MDETNHKKNDTEQSISDSEVAIEEMEGLIAKPTEGLRIIERGPGLSLRRAEGEAKS